VPEVSRPDRLAVHGVALEIGERFDEAPV